MPVRDTVALLRELDPEGGPPRRADRSRRPVVRLAAVATLALVAVGVGVGVGTVTTGRESRAPGLVASAYAALTASDRIVHLKLSSRFFDPMDEPATTELWSRAGGRQLRVVYEGGATEFVRDTDRGYAAAYTRHTDTLTLFTEREMVEPVTAQESYSFAGAEGAARLADALPALLARARDGDSGVRRLPDGVLDGRATARLETVAVILMAGEEPDGERPPDLRPVRVRTVVWLDLGTRLPRRIEQFADDQRVFATGVVAERLKFDADTEGLLDMPERPNARRVVGGRG